MPQLAAPASAKTQSQDRFFDGLTWCVSTTGLSEGLHWAQARHSIVSPAAMRYYLTIMALIQKIPPTETLKVCTVKLTPTAERTLRRLSQDASDNLGWTVSSSAILRALLSYAEQRPPAWAPAALYPFVEQEIARGRVWGKKKRM